jgi:dolichyl-phosphate-mannose-protein mannosyltransferase
MLRLKKPAHLDRIIRFAPWIVTLWVVAMTCWYCRTVVRSVLNPPNGGDDLRLAAIWLVLAGLVLLSNAIFPRRLVALLWLEIQATFGLFMIVWSEQLIAALIAGWLLALAWIWGDWLLRRFGVKQSDSAIELVSLAVPVGLVLLSLVGLTLMIAHRMTEQWTYAVLIGMTLLQWRSFRDWFESIRRKLTGWSLSKQTETLPEQGVLLTWVGIVGLFNLAWALAPEIMYDAVNYHLAVPKAYLAEHRLVDLSYGHNARLVHSLYTLSLALHSQIVAKLLVLATGVITALGVYSLGRRLFNERTGLWAAALFYSTALVSWLSSTTYIDLVVAMFMVAMILAFVRWTATRENPWLWLTGLLGGAAVGSKLNAAFALPVVVVVLLWTLHKARHLAPSTKVKGLVGAALAACIVAGPYFFIEYIRTGNPFFPLLNGMFSAGSFRAAANLNSDAWKFSLGSSPLALLRFPWVVTFDSQRLGHPPGAVGVCLMLLPLALLLVLLRRVEIHVLLAVSAAYVVLLTYTVPLARYYIPILPIVVVLAVAVVIHFSSTKRLRRANLACLGLMIVAQPIVTPLQFWQIPDRVPLKLALGLETPDDFLKRALPPYAAASYLNKVMRPGEKVIDFGVEYVRFYLNAPLLSGERRRDLGQWQKETSAPDLAAKLVRNRYNYLIVERTNASNKIFSKDFLDRFANIEFTGNRVDVYRLTEIANEPAMVINLLSNPGFETLGSSDQPAGWSMHGQPLVAKNAAEAHEGDVAVLARKDDGFTMRVPVEPGNIYLLGHWSRANRPGQFARLQINWVDERMQLIDASIEVVSAETGWTWHDFFATAPPGAAFGGVYVSVHGDSEVWFDDYVFRKL